jgi:hypothetical protein
MLCSATLPLFNVLRMNWHFDGRFIRCGTPPLSCPWSRWRLTATRVQDLPFRNSVITPMKPPQARLFRQGAPSGSVCCVGALNNRDFQVQICSGGRWLSKTLGRGSKKSVQQGHSQFCVRSVRLVREHGKMARTPLAAFFNRPCVDSGHVYEPSEAGSGHRLRPFRVEVHPPHQDRV